MAVSALAKADLVSVTYSVYIGSRVPTHRYEYGVTYMRRNPIYGGMFSLRQIPVSTGTAF